MGKELVHPRMCCCALRFVFVFVFVFGFVFGFVFVFGSLGCVCARCACEGRDVAIAP